MGEVCLFGIRLLKTACHGVSGCFFNLLLAKKQRQERACALPFWEGVVLVSFLPFHLYADWFIPFATALLELCRLRRAWEGDDVANVLHAGNEEDEPFEAQTETSVGA